MKTKIPQIGSLILIPIAVCMFLYDLLKIHAFSKTLDIVLTIIFVSLFVVMFWLMRHENQQKAGHDLDDNQSN